MVPDPSAGAWNAVDGAPGTAWFPRGIDGAGSWWEVRGLPLSEQPSLRLSVVASLDVEVGWVDLRVTTDLGERTVRAPLPGDLSVPGLTPTTAVRIEVLGSSLPPGIVPGLAEVGLAVQRSVVPPPLAPGASVVVLSARPGARSACVVRLPINCLPSLERAGEEAQGLDRVVTTSAVTGPLEVSVTGRPGPELDRLLLPPGPAPVASASSVRVPQPAVRAQSAIDDDPATAWVADSADRAPTLTVRLARPATLSWLRIRETAGLGASRPLGVTVRIGERSLPLIADDAGFLRFPPTRTTSLTLEFTSSRPVLSYDTATQRRVVLPVGVSELVLGAAEGQKVAVSRSARIVLPCGAGPEVVVDGGRRLQTRVETTAGALLTGAPVSAAACSADAGLDAGTHRLTVTSGGAWDVTGLRWGSVDARALQPGVAEVTDWGPTERSVVVPAASFRRALELTENYNPGWTASLDGTALEPARVDGWRQAWWLPAGASGQVSLVFAPDRTYRTALAVGGAAALVLVLVALFGMRGAPLATTGRARRHGRRARPWLIGGVSLVTLGLSGAAAALSTYAVVARTGRRVRWAVGGAITAGLPAVIAPWPTGTTWPVPVLAASAVVVAVGAGIVLGALAAPVNAGAPSSEPDVPPADR